MTTPQRPTLGLLMIARDAERHLAPCLAGLDFLDQAVIVVDTRTTDRTAAIAREHGAEVVFHPFSSMVEQRLVALEHLRTDWVLVVDADERIPPALAAEIRAAVAGSPDDVAGYWIPRRNLMVGREVRHAGWFPDYQFRLWRRHRARYDPLQPAHEQMLVDGERRTLSVPMLHYNYDRYGQLFAKQAFYAGQEARVMARQGIRARPQNFLLQPLREFWRRAVTLQGWRDGWFGLFLAAVMGWSQFVLYRELARLNGIEWRPGRGPAIAPGGSAA